jgi:hypothetical protein
MIIKQLKEISVHRSIINSMIYAMYKQANFERWDSWFGSYSKYSLYSIFTNALKQARIFQRDHCDEAHDEEGCNDDDDGWAKDCGLIQRDDCDEAHDEDGCNDDDDCWAEDCGLWFGGVFALCSYTALPA